MKYAILLLTVVGSMLSAVAKAQDNPFVKMAGKPYSEYGDELEVLLYKPAPYTDKDTIWAEQIVAQLHEVAVISKEKKWELEADFFALQYYFIRDEKSHTYNKIQKDSLTEIYVRKIQEISRNARKIKATAIELHTMKELWSKYDDLYGPDMLLGYVKEMDDRLSAVTADEYPSRPFLYAQIGNLYYYFREYEKAKLYYEKGLENTDVWFDRPATIHIADIKQLLNNIGLIYRYHYNNLEKSDYYFNRILEIPFSPALDSDDKEMLFLLQNEHDLWAELARGNLGTNFYLRGDYDSAIPLLISSMEKAVQYNDYNYPYAIGKAVLLAEIFLEKNDLITAKRYIDKANEYLEALRKRAGASGISSEVELMISYYQIMSRYHRIAGYNEQAFLYADSAINAHNQYDEIFNLRKVHYLEMGEKQQQLELEMLRNKVYYRNLMMVSVVALLFLILITLLYYFYRQQQAAYRALVLKTKQWAQTPFSTDKSLQNKETLNQASEIDRQIFDQLNQLMVEKQLYLDANTTLDAIAQVMGINRMYLSQAINNCTGDNFNIFINEFRVKEAVRLMSNGQSHNLTIEGIAFDVGFNNRFTFNRVFKKSTGCSPALFRRQAQV